LLVAEISPEPIHCAECGRELVDLEPDGSAPTRCKDCLGAGSAIADRLSINLNELRARSGISLNELSNRAAMDYSTISEIEGDGAHELRLTTALRLVHPLGASIDQLTERIYWNPGQIVHNSRDPSKERLSGFFLVLPSNMPVFEPAPPCDPVTTREEAAAIFGANVRRARERRHLTQQALSRDAGLSKAGLSLIERGVRETSIRTLLALARSLEVAPEPLLDGITWKSQRPPCEGSRARHPGRSLDGAICRLWNEDKTTREIADAVGTSPGTVSATVHRLRERGEPLRYRRRPTRAVHERARRRRPLCRATRADEDSALAGAVDPLDRGGASNGEIALRLGANVARHREEAGLSLRQFAEAAETHFSHLSKVERGKSGIPQLALILRLAGSLNVRCGLITAGIVWDSTSGLFQVKDAPPEPQQALGRLGQNVQRARRRADLSQLALSDRAAMSRGDLVDFERGARNFRIFTVVRLAGALEIGFAELFAGVANWHIRPLAPPEFLPGEAPTKAERDELLVRLWSQGRGEQEIAEALDLSRASIGPYVRDLRDSGVQLAYRRPPRSRAEFRARRRRDGHAATLDYG
jgi:transcriptional regulator with XRE-family HTH domain/biotin operon repressor